jgi:hypothetical protein
MVTGALRSRHGSLRMSIEIPTDQLFAELHVWGSGFLATVGDDGRARFVCLTPEVFEGEPDAGDAAMRFRRAGRTAAANIIARPNVSVVFPAHSGSGGYSLIVDGLASLVGVNDDQDPPIDVRPTWAVLHRPAP